MELALAIYFIDIFHSLDDGFLVFLVLIATGILSAVHMGISEASLKTNKETQNN